nr:cation transporter [Chitinophagaceae bacterium]
MSATTINWKVDGMTCANCALSINKTLAKEGLKDISVNVITGEVSFETVEPGLGVEHAKSKVEMLGYKVSNQQPDGQKGTGQEKAGLSKYMLYFWISLPFTAVLIRSGIPNMNVLIALGATAAFGYSCWGIFQPQPQNFMFFETAASIITIVFLGYYLEDVSVAKTQQTIKAITREQVVDAYMIAYDAEGNENVFKVESSALQVGDLVMIRTGEQVPADCKILSGEAEINEALL